VSDSAMTESIQGTLRRYLIDELGLPESIQAESLLMESGLLVSAQLLDLVVFLEDTYGIVLRPIDVVPEKIRTIASISTVVHERRVAEGLAP
jgi:acyl carrier protein